MPRSASTAAAASFDSVVNSLTACVSVSASPSSGVVGRDADAGPAAVVCTDPLGAAVVVATVAEAAASG
jgi:hypothetical protein